MCPLGSGKSYIRWRVPAQVSLVGAFRRPVLDILSKLVKRMDLLPQPESAVKRQEIVDGPSASADRDVIADILGEIPGSLIEDARETAHNDPRAAVLTAARALDLAMLSTMEKLNIEPTGGFGRDVWQLWDIGAIRPTDANRLTELQQLRNVADHESADGITTASARDYVAAAENMIVTLREAGKHRRPSDGPPR